MKFETIEEYLARGGVITICPSPREVNMMRALNKRKKRGK